MKIAIVIGHDANSQGAYGNMGVSEWIFNDEFMSELFFKEMMPDKHTYYVLYRNANISGYTNKMIELHNTIDEIGCEISVELHFNSFSDTSATGHEVLYCSENGKKIAQKLDEAFDNNLETTDRGLKKITMNDNGGGFCCRGKSYAIISEPFFGAHQSKFSHDGIQRKALLDSFYDFFNSIDE